MMPRHAQQSYSAKAAMRLALCLRKSAAPKPPRPELPQAIGEH
jgi:hypothetical protein